MKTRRSFLTWLALVALGALALRLVCLAELRNAPVLSVLIGDGQQYDTWAQQIAGGQWMGTEVFYQTPLYPYLLAVVFKLVGHHLLAVRAMQAVLGAASCALLGLAGRRFFDERVGLIAAALLAIYPPAIFFDVLIQKSSLDVFLVALTLALLGQFVARPHWKWLVAAGVAMGLFTLNRENARILYPIVLVWLLVYFRQTSWRTRLTWAAIFTISLGAVLLPVGIRNYHVGGEFLVSTAQLGPNLYIGNHAGASGGYEALVPDHGNASWERTDATQLAETALGRTLTAGEVSDYWFNRSFDYIRSQPLNWLGLMGRKLLLTFNASESVDTESIEVYAEYSSLLRALLWFNFGIVLPLAAFGAWYTRRNRRHLALLYGVVFGLAVSVAFFYVLARYRYPMVPVLMLFAAAGLFAVRAAVRPQGVPDRRNSRRQWMEGVLVATIAAVACHLPLQAGDDETCLNLGIEMMKAGRPADAIPMLQQAIDRSPAFAASYFNLGVAFDRVGEKQKALEQFAAAVQLRPDYFEAHGALALALRDTGQPGAALEHFREMVRLRPQSPEARGDLGLTLVSAGQPAEAIVELEEALRLRPDDAMVHNNLAGILQQQGRLPEAIGHYQAAIRLKPDYAEAHSNLALALKATGHDEAAREEFTRALGIQPASFGIQMNFGDLLMEMGRVEDAVGHYGQAVALAPDSMDAHYRMAQALARGGQIAAAIDSLGKALAIAQATGQEAAARQIAAVLRACQSQAGARGR